MKKVIFFFFFFLKNFSFCFFVFFSNNFLILECILTESGVLRSPKNVLIKPEGFEDLISNQELFNALKKEWLSPHVDSKIMMERMNIKEFSLIDMIEFLNALKDDEIQAKSHKWIARLYEFFEKFVNDKLDQYIPQLLGFKVL